MGRIRKILWIIGGLILGITLINMLSQVYWKGLGWDGINLQAYIFWYIFGSTFIVGIFVYDIISYISFRSNVHELIDKTERITPEEIAKILDEPLWRVLPIFRKRYEPGILIDQSGKYMHFNEIFKQKFLKEYLKDLTIGEHALNFDLSKSQIGLIIEELDYLGILPDKETPIIPQKQEITTKGLRKTVRLRKKKMKRHKR
ncbi:MAG: hypothetical protein ACFFD2_24740 [Promethearchaeota archaeon]